MGNCMSTGEPWLDITLLCKVVDNYGDIGFVYRLARSLSRIEPSVRLRFIVSDLVSFAKMAPGLRVDTAEQTYNGWTVLDWNSSEVCTAAYKKNPPQVILECFQCGRPSWLDDILFDKTRTDIVHILNVEYLTAEKWADDFHLLKSGTRSAMVKKVNFMPGFSAKTGGLVLDEPFVTFLHDHEAAEQAVRNGVQAYCRGEIAPCSDSHLSEADVSLFGRKNVCTVVVFSYPRSFLTVVQALAAYEKFMKKAMPDFSVHVFLADGICREPFLKAYKDFFDGQCDYSPGMQRTGAGCSPFGLTELPFLPQ